VHRRTVVLLAGLFLVACGARVPSDFTPAPVPASIDEIEITDHRGQDELVALVFGDAGTGSDDQREVGRRMAEVCSDVGCDLALILGDNFYDRGVRSPDNGRWDPAFVEKFEEPYNGLGRLDMWAVAGNHDWYRGPSSIDTQIAYSERSERWRMLAYDYAVPDLPEWLRIYALDTTIIDTGVDIGQLDRAEAELCGSAGWKILVGHHPLLTTGRHADRNGEVPRVNRAVRPLVEQCGVQLYLSGHDHHQEHLTADGFDQIIQGAAGGTRAVGERPADQRGIQRFAARKYGFAILHIRPDVIDVSFYGYEPGRREAFDVIYETSIRR